LGGFSEALPQLPAQSRRASEEHADVGATTHFGGKIEESGPHVDELGLIAAARRDQGLILPGTTKRERRDDQGIRRNRRWRTLRWIPDRDVAGSEGISGSLDRPGHLSQ
jgi:hypothetical protein